MEIDLIDLARAQMGESVALRIGEKPIKAAVRITIGTKEKQRMADLMPVLN